MAVKYKHVEKDDELGVHILEGVYTDVIVQFGRVQFTEAEDGQRGMKFQYKLLDKPKDLVVQEEECMPVFGDILVDIIEQQLEAGEVVYANGAD
jgi:hypothetical protein